MTQNRLRRSFLAALFTLVLGAGAASAGDAYAPPAYRTVVCYERVTTYETRTEPYTKKVHLYDDCGNCIVKTVTCYRDVQVPVVKVVAVRKRVPVCE